MRILVSALACVPFVIKHIMLENFVPTPTQALLRFSIQWVRPILVVVPEPRSTQRILQWIEDVKIRLREVGSVRKVWYALKPQLLNNRQCCCSSMWLGIFVEETHPRRQQPVPFLPNSWLQIFPQD